jgi:hypothetical protein
VNKYERFSKAKLKRSCLGRSRPKIRFTEKEAKLALDNYPSEKKRKPVRAYHCPICLFWHLTSREESNMNGAAEHQFQEAAKSNVAWQQMQGLELLLPEGLTLQELWVEAWNAGFHSGRMAGLREADRYGTDDPHGL